MEEKKFQFKIGKIILLSNGIVFGVAIIMTFLDGYTSDELSRLIQFLVPVMTVYMAATIKFLIDNKKYVKEEEADKIMLSKQYVKITTLVIYIHFVVVAIAIIMKGLGMQHMTIDELLTILTIVETIFGAYVGTIIVNLLSKTVQESNMP